MGGQETMMEIKLGHKFMFGVIEGGKNNPGWFVATVIIVMIIVFIYRVIRDSKKDR